MPDRWQEVPGILVPGHRVASAPSDDYPYGTLERQKQFFKAGGMDLDAFHTGTLNISIAPTRWAMQKPALTLRAVAWTDLHPPEDFSFSACRVCFDGGEYAGWVYYPHPETKIRHFQDPGLIEVITTFIAGIGYGSQVVLLLDPEQIAIEV